MQITIKELNALIKESLEKIEIIKFLKTLNGSSLEEMEKKLTDNFPILGKGSARIVFSIDDDLVVKLALTNKGIDQNKEEATIESCSSNNSLFANIISKANDFSWIVMERAIQLTSDQEFSEKINLDPKLLREVLVFWYAENMQTTKNRNMRPEHYDEIIDLPFVRSLIKLIKECNLLPLDISKFSSWGVLPKSKKLVLIDYGLTKQVFLKHYY